MNNENGHWITYQGRKIFISDDPTEKQYREIAEQESNYLYSNLIHFPDKKRLKTSQLKRGMWVYEIGSDDDTVRQVKKVIYRRDDSRRTGYYDVTFMDGSSSNYYADDEFMIAEKQMFPLVYWEKGSDYMSVGNIMAYTEADAVTEFKKAHPKAYNVEIDYLH